MIVTTRHLFTCPGFGRRPGFCRDGARRSAVALGLDWRDFVRHGIESEKLIATGNGFALALVAWAEKCEARERAHG